MSNERNNIKIAVMSGVTIDGKLSLKRGVTSGSINSYLSDACVTELHRWRGVFDSIMIGGNTVEIDDPSLTARYPGAKNPTRVIVGPEGTIPLTAKVFDVSDAQTILAVTTQTNEDYKQALREKGVDVVEAGTGKFVDMGILVNYLESKGLRYLMVEGGSIINWLMLNEGLVDEVFIFSVPIITGTVSAPTFVEGPQGKEFEEPVVLKWQNTNMFDGIPLHHYKVKK